MALQPFVRTALARFSALWLVVLVFLPVTAPFQTCEVSDLFGAGRANRAPATPSPTAQKDTAAALVRSVAAMARPLKMSVHCASDRHGFDEPFAAVVACSPLTVTREFRPQISAILRQ